jgi:nicotinamide mononucleotide adenylyltransferase
MKKVVIYSGRFQPMLSHHAEVYNRLQMEFPDAEIYVGTSDKVEGTKSPFNFKEKQMIAQAHGLDPNKVLLAKRPYHKDDYSKYFNEDNTQIFFAVGEKDLDRFPFSNVDDKTGLDMTVRGEPKPKYYQKINTYSNDPQPMSMRGYITLAPTVTTGDEVASASAFRSAMLNAPTEVKAIEIYTKQFGEFNQQVFDLIYKKIKGSEMNENINILRKLAGLSEAPVEFDTKANPKDVTFLPPGANSAKLSIANRFPQDADPNSPEVKKDEFVKALMKSPASLLSEINERLDPKDANNEAVGVKLNKIISKLERGGIQDLEQDDKSFVIDVVKVAIKDMDLVAGDDSEPEFDNEPEPEIGDDEMVPVFDPKEESVDLSDIKSEYGIEEVEEISEGGECYHCDGTGSHGDKECKSCKGTGFVQFDDDPQEPSQEEMDKHAKKESAPFGEPSEDEEMYDKLITAYENGEEDLAEVLGMSMEELDQEMTEFAMDHKLHMDDDRDEVVQGYIEDLVHNRDAKDYGSAMYDDVQEEKEKNCGCGKDPCETYGKVEETADKAMQAAIQELKALAGLNS